MHHCHWGLLHLLSHCGPSNPYIHSCHCPITCCCHRCHLPCSCLHFHSPIPCCLHHPCCCHISCCCHFLCWHCLPSCSHSISCCDLHFHDISSCCPIPS